MNNFKQKPPEVKFESVQVKRFKDVSQDKGPNWWFIISMPDGIEYKGYASEDCQQLSDIVIQNNNNEIETIVGMTGHQVSKPNYEFQDCKFYYEGKSLTAKTVVQKQSPKPITTTFNPAINKSVALTTPSIALCPVPNLLSNKCLVSESFTATTGNRNLLFFSIDFSLITPVVVSSIEPIIEISVLSV